MSQFASNDLQAKLRIGGMHCASCEILLERKLRSLKGMKRVSINHQTGIAQLTANGNALPSFEEIEAIINSAGYSCANEENNTSAQPATRARQNVSTPEGAEPTGRKWKEIGAALIIIFALWKFLQAFDLVSLAPTTSGVASLGGVFVIGIVAGLSSCLAVTGGLLLAVSAKYNEVNRCLSPWQKFQPLLHFNIGRLASYFVLGGIVGLIGESITLSARMTGYTNIVVALVMLYLALTILKIFPKGSFPIKPPKRLSHWIADLSENKHPAAPFALGGLTFFLPCGFTQSLQLVALASGSFFTGALTMFTFALGTLPALLSISAISSSSSKTTSRLFMRFAGALVLVLSLYNLNSALAITGIDVSGLLGSLTAASAADNTAPSGDAPAINNGVQEVAMKVKSYGYEPSTMTIKAGVPVRWVIDGSGASGCTSGIIVPSLNISKILERGQNIIEFTAPNPGKLAFSCSMGMVRGSFKVI